MEATVTHFSVHAVEAVLGERSEALASFLRVLDQTAGLSVYDTTITDEVAASLLASNMHLDFDDALQYYCARKLGAESIVSFDKHFDGLGLPRREPRDLLK